MRSWLFPVVLIKCTFSEFLNRAGGAGPTTPTLVRPKVWLFMVKVLHSKSSGRTNNCQIEILFKRSDQSYTPSAALVLLIYVVDLVSVASVNIREITK